MPISYDGALNPLSYVINGSECTLTWTQGRRLASISGEEGTDYTYTYNDEGIRTGKTVNGVEHIYHLSGTQILSEEWTENGVQYLIVYSYDASGYPISMTYRKSTDAATAAEVYFLATNLQGDVTYIYDIDGNRVVTYNYDAWGNILSISGTKASTIGRYNTFRYRSYYYDNETGFYYLNSRYYDPASGRFLNADGQLNDGLLGYNLFAYCENNPVSYTDPTGEWPDWDKLFKGALLAAIGVMTVVAVVSTGGTCIPIIAAAYAVLATAGVVATMVGASEVVESFTGNNPVRDYVGEDMYDALKYGSMTVVSYGSAIIEVGTSISVCFVEGTEVSAASGHIAIETVKVGDMVWATDPETGETGLKEVVRTFVNETSELVHIKVNGEEIICTNEHPFYSPVKGWTAAIQLRAGDKLQLLNGEYVIIEQIQHELLESPVKVYNFEVEDFHTYYVGETEALVHNMCAKKSDIKQVEQVAKKLGMDDKQRRDFGDYIEDLKWDLPNNKNFSFKELIEIGKELLEKYRK